MAETLPSRVAGVIFDMDDTLFDSEKAWHEAAAALWRDAGGVFRGYGDRGGTVEDLANAFLDEFGGGDEREERMGDVCARLEDAIRERLDVDLAPMPGADALTSRLAQVVPLAIGSNSPQRIVEQCVRAIGWQERFTAALGVSAHMNPKPAPDLYREAARRLGADPRDCVIFEDSPTGARAAVASGAFVVTIGDDARGIGTLAVDTLNDDIVTSWTPEQLT
ncbi:MULTISPECIES: HAD family hydrolase [Dermabacter]|uniref:HAD family hydrolase n=1 Tax=Dermabacter TaxID=36739 RepID=UPI000353C232|nr:MULTISPECIES: HAD family phosphatase [Dermabacter]EPH15211.1 HAD hydrolase, family IA [Dermabacter sp. HFH0086]MCT1709937.1 HAD family phosphatase [Dermabacter hominis]MCT1806464.1 HAD family phosphatase [Dermabacter hominis]MCT2056328.1 HAD family phosphatase [Dermabacter hominis]MCT2091489.1 HAD family phosphatase [Dermabacter hominis]